MGITHAKYLYKYCYYRINEIYHFLYLVLHHLQYQSKSTLKHKRFWAKPCSYFIFQSKWLKILTTSATSIVGNNILSQSSTHVALNAATLIPFKLNREGNYASWRSQFAHLLFGYDLSGYIDRSHPCPEEKISNSNETTTSS